VTSVAGLVALVEPSKAILPRLSVVERDVSQWRTLLRCPDCSSFWIEEYPWSELHGGGAAVLLPVPDGDPEAYFRSTATMVASLRRRHDDAEFLAKLGAEVGPEVCRDPGCDRRRITASVCCRLHHFQMVRGGVPSAG